MTEVTARTAYSDLVGYISSTYNQGRQKAVQAINASLLEAYWEIGRYIVEFEQGGAMKAKYVIQKVRRRLTNWGGRVMSSCYAFVMLSSSRHPGLERQSNG